MVQYRGIHLISVFLLANLKVKMTLKTTFKVKLVPIETTFSLASLTGQKIRQKIITINTMDLKCQRNQSYPSYIELKIISKVHQV